MSMFGGLTEGGDAPYIKITTPSATYIMPTYDLEGRPAVVAMQPQEPFDQVSIIGDTSKVADRRAAQIIPTDQSGGAGRDAYDETEGVTDYRQSDWDTRRAGALVLRPERTLMTNSIATSITEGARVTYVGYTGADLHAWSIDGRLWHHDGTDWAVNSVPFIIVGMRGHAQAFGYTFISAGGDTVFRTIDGLVFEEVTNSAFVPGYVYGLCAFDNKLWTFVADPGGALSFRLAASTNPDAADPNDVVWTDVAFLRMGEGDNERVVKLFAWKDASNSPALFILTSRRLLVYNAVGNTIEDYSDFSEDNPEGVDLVASHIGIDAVVFRASGDLYVAEGYHTDYLMRYSPGAGFGKVSPNGYGGLEADRQGSPRTLAQNAYGIGVWMAPTSEVGGSSSTGGAWFLDANGGWHCLNRDLSGAGRQVIGGGIGNRKFWTVFDNGDVEEQPLPSVGNRPQFAIGGRYDDSVEQVHEYAETDGGTALLRKTLLGFTLHTLLSDGTNAFGLDTDTYVRIEYRINGGAWTAVTQYVDTAGTVRTLPSNRITSTLVSVGWPLRLLVGGAFGVPWYTLGWRVIGKTDDPDKTPVLVTCAPRYVRTPTPHYTYETVVNVAELETMGGPPASTVGGGPSAVAATLDTLDSTGYMMTLEFGGPGVRRTVRSCEFAMAPQLMSHLGTGRYRLIFKDVGSDNSGVA